MKLNKKILLAVAILIVLVGLIFVFIFVRKGNDDKAIIGLSCERNDKWVEINDNETITIPCGVKTSVSVNNYAQVRYPSISWSVEGVEPSIVITSENANCYFYDDKAETVKVIVSGDKIVTRQFYIEFIEQQPELLIKNTAWKAGGIKYYLKEDGTIYVIFDGERNYIKGTYNYVKKSEDEIDDKIKQEFQALFSDGLYYQVDVNVSEEYLADKVYNNDSLYFYFYGNKDNCAIYDGGWGFTKIAEPVLFMSDADFERIFDEAREKASAKQPAKNLGNMSDTAWCADNINYYFYNDGTFESISLINHDFIKGTYTCQELDESQVDEALVNEFKEQMVPKKYFNITCNVEREIYNGENVNVTNLNIIIAQNGIKFAMYDSNWNTVNHAVQIDMEAKEDFDVFFARSKVDITGKFSGNQMNVNGVVYTFAEDGTYQAVNEAEDTSIKGSYIAVDVYDDLIEDSLLDIIKNDDYYYVEIKLDKVWHEKKETVEENKPSCIFLIMSVKDDQAYIYDSYFGTYDDVSEMKKIGD